MRYGLRTPLYICIVADSGLKMPRTTQCYIVISTPNKDSGCSACKCVVDQKTCDGSKILATVLQSHFKHGEQNTQQQRFAIKEKGVQTCKGKNRYSG